MLLQVPKSHPSYFRKPFVLKSAFFLFLLVACSSAWHIGRLRATESAQRSFTSVTPEDMNQIENLHSRAEDLIAQKKFRDAISVYSEIVLTEPDDDDAYTNMGQAYMVLGDYTHAKDAFQNALHINPDNEVATMGLRKIADPDYMTNPEPAPENAEQNITETPQMSAPVVTDEKPAPSQISAQTPVQKQIVTVPTPAVTVEKPVQAPVEKQIVTASAPIVPAEKPAPVQVSIQKQIVIPPAEKPVVKKAPPIILFKPKLSKAETETKPIQPVVPSSESKPASVSSDINTILSSPLSFNQITQMALQNAGLYHGPINGVTDMSTQKAVETFQKNNQLETNGMVDPGTWSKLKPYLDKKN